MPTRRRFDHATRSPRAAPSPAAPRPERAHPLPRPRPVARPPVAGRARLRVPVLALVLLGAVGIGAALGLGRPAAPGALLDPAVADVDREYGDGADLDPGPQGDGAPAPDPAGEASAPDVVPPPLSGYAWPLDDARITSSFGYRRGSDWTNDGVPWHDGIDLASFCGDRITAAHDGVVLAASRRYDTYSGWVGDLTAAHERRDELGLWGNMAIGVVIDDGNGYRSVYLHFSRVVVKAGQRVKAGDFLGYEGRTGNASGCHLHFSIFKTTETATYRLDPRIVAKSLVPDREIARLDPITVLPPPESANVTWGWGALPSPRPS